MTSVMSASHSSFARRDSTYSIQASPVSSHSPSHLEILYHGTCRHCSHLHTAYPVKLSKDSRQHVRLQCEKCRQDMSGFGRTSTQTTLASQETLEFNRRNSRDSTQLAPSNAAPCTNAGRASFISPRSTLITAAEVPHGLGALSPITEIGSAVGRSRSTSQLHARDLRQTVECGVDQTLPPAQHPIHPSRDTTTADAATSFNGKKSKIRRIFNNLRFSLRPEEGHRSRTPQDRMRSLLTWKTIRRPRGHDQKHHQASSHPNERPSRAQEISPANVPSPTVRERTAQSEAIRPLPFPAGPTDHPSDAQRTKQDRIGTIRREKTMERNAQRMVPCQCTSDCHCLSRGPPSNLADIGQESSPEPDNPWHYPMHNSSDESEGSYPRVLGGSHVLAEIGAQHDETNTRSQSPETPSSTAVSSQVPSDHYSISTTAVGNDSSVAINRRPPLDRSTSVPAPLRRPRSQYQSSLRGSPRNRSNLRFTRDIDGSSSSRRMSDASRTGQGSSSPSRIGSTESVNRRHSINGEISRNLELSPGLAHDQQHPQYELTPQPHEGQLQVNGTSEEITPRPRSQIIQTDEGATSSQPEPSHLSQALQELSSERTHPGPTPGSTRP